MLAPAAKLKWLVLRTSGLLGDISCDILLPGLTLLSLTRNGLTVHTACAGVEAPQQGCVQGR